MGFSTKIIGLISIVLIFMLFTSAICVVKILRVQKGIFQFLETQRLISRHLHDISKNQHEHRILFEEAASLGHSRRNDKSLQQKYSGSVKSFRNSCEHVQKNIAEVQNHVFGLVNSETHIQAKNDFVKFNKKISDINNHHSLRISYEQTFFALTETGIKKEARLKAEAVSMEEKYLSEAIADLLKELKTYTVVEIRRHEKQMAEDGWLLTFIVAMCLIATSALSHYNYRRKQQERLYRSSIHKSEGLL